MIRLDSIRCARYLALMDANNHQATVRYPEQVKARIDRVHREMAKDFPGLSLAVVLRRLLEAGLAAEEKARGIEPPG